MLQAPCLWLRAAEARDRLLCPRLARVPGGAQSHSVFSGSDNGPAQPAESQLHSEGTCAQ